MTETEEVVPRVCLMQKLEVQKYENEVEWCASQQGVVVIIE